MSLSNPIADPHKFYRGALDHAFLTSGALAAETGRSAGQIVDRPEFEVMMSDPRASSLDLARRVGDMAVVHLSSAAAPWQWWKELLAYERAYFLQLAATDQRLVTYFPRRGVAATSVNFTWDMPQLLARIREKNKDLNGVPRRQLTLLFSRPREGNVYVIELERPVAAVFRFTNGMRKKEQIAEAAGMSLDEVDAILRALAEIGAVENI